MNETTATKNNWRHALTLTNEITLRDGYTLKYISDGAYIAASLCCMTEGWRRDSEGDVRRSWVSLSARVGRDFRQYAVRLDRWMSARSEK